MPLVKIEMLSGKTPEFKKTVFDCVHGRTKDQKKAAIERITGLLVERLNITPTDVFIVMNEPPLENWGMGGNQKL